MKNKKIFFWILWSISFLGYSQTPPDSPLTPQQWIDKMGIGHWWIFTVPPNQDTNITTNYSEQILDSLQTKFCINGGRLHWVAKDMYDANDELLQAPLDNLRTMIDAFMARNMAISLNIQFVSTADEQQMTLQTRQKIVNAWTKVSNEFKDVSHNLAMSPVIEFHGWQTLPRPQRVDSLNVLYHQLTRIYRQYNPTRIMSYKPWGSAKRAEFQDLDYPFGDDPLPNNGQPFYYVSSFSGSAGLGDWNTWSPTMPQADLDALHFQTINGGSSDANNIWGIRAAIQHRTNTGIPFWCDHWRPNYHKNYGTPEQWTMEQNLAYVAFFENKLLEIGSAGAGFQTRTFWSDTTNDLIRLTNTSSNKDIMSVQFMDLLETMCDEANLSVLDKEYSVQIYPNPTKKYIYIEMDNVVKEDLHIYNFLGQRITNLSIKYNTSNKASIDLKNLEKGIYFIKSKNITTQFIKN